jgi:hypothetical protein
LNIFNNEYKFAFENIKKSRECLIKKFLSR